MTMKILWIFLFLVHLSNSQIVEFDLQGEPIRLSCHLLSAVNKTSPLCVSACFDDCEHPDNYTFGDNRFIVDKNKFFLQRDALLLRYALYFLSPTTANIRPFTEAYKNKICKEVEFYQF